MFVGDDGAGVIQVFGGGEKANGFLLKAGLGPPQLVAYDDDKVIGEAVWGPSPHHR